MILYLLVLYIKSIIPIYVIKDIRQLRIILLYKYNKNIIVINILLLMRMRYKPFLSLFL